ncbi:adenosylcobinamide kinase/adenosylcobinamide phosphate guanylyltransferase [Agrobacterium rubi TR3 = NBRC 13261]|uniref:Bifunctional adenosylcobalamin biosynthesis protein n=1 Tax=Agrobacterium rubi TR3 = NBRC 13261 TaxID=1368415 RepID=A0A081CW14_9HYPH|nr:bifunctional adenosylcobinamide kinase/adenosylcobinamide-phosphate guanylyltransferase [Agrobacterium rubi]MBP1877824.1 adenosylcobinamide kinase/adenosylcobinamide-phosphate guanylyltransferase [Agrobacterium rubi]MCL6651989.1 bifunctional adenosylcobinamide kinase/adenosylcobinamide-phosphate guanylyltransferase [Agrobacterium rubi]GAK70860.1 adenosylcobinamide kinase/adenosylcobinamide phosphate guanylyltransferase [Agrobacterium rubi TR3 = NBRC 13261]
MTDASRAVLVLGGARSGKSAFAENLVLSGEGAALYIATGRAWDDEMKDRISDHRDRRSDVWTTHEEPLALTEVLQQLDRPEHTILVDCLTLWVTNLMMEEARDVEVAFAPLVQHAAVARAKIVFVSNEVGLGIVPENRMAREFRDHAGRLHQKIAAVAAEVYFVAAGLPLKMKG